MAMALVRSLFLLNNIDSGEKPQGPEQCIPVAGHLLLDLVVVVIFDQYCQFFDRQL